MRGAILRLSRAKVACEHMAESGHFDLDMGTREVCDQLSGRTRLPRAGVLVTSDAVPALLSLPVDPDSERPPEQMQQLVRWEIEPRLLEHISSFQLGTLLLTRGVLTREQLQEVLRSQARSSAEGARTRFGRVAMELGYITPLQLEEGLTIQERRIQMAQSAEFLSSWEFQRKTSEGAVWVACTVPRDLVAASRATLAGYGVKLGAVYPRSGAPALGLTTGLKGRRVLLVDEAPSGLEASLVSDKAFEVIGSRQLAEQLMSGSQEALGSEPADAVWYSGDGAWVDQLDALGLERSQCPAGSGAEGTSLPAAAAGALFGVARHYLGGGALGKGLAISTKEPSVPLRKRGGVQVLLGMLVVVGLVFGYHEYLRYRLDSLTRKNTTLVDAVDQLSSGAGAIRASTEKRIENVLALEGNALELEELAEEIGFLSDTLDERGAYLMALLDGLTRYITPDMELDSVIEDIALGLQVKGWSFRESSAQAFSSSFTDLLEGYGVSFGSISLTAESERQGVNGYLFEIRYEQTEGRPRR